MLQKIAIMGDQFMLADLFEQALHTVLGEELSSKIECRKLNMPWPDEDMQHGYAEPAMEGLKEYQGTAEEVLAHIADATIFITHLAPMSAAMFQQLPALDLLAVSRGGPVNVDMAAARKHGVRVVNTPGRNASAVAEFTIGAIIAETRNICRGHESLRRDGVWRGDLYRADTQRDELSNLCVGVIGNGAIGSRVVQLLKAFGSKILVSDPYVQLSQQDRNDGVLAVSHETLLAQSDIVTLHARVSAETTGFINADSFQAMKPGALFVNTARGPLVDYGDLYDALVSGQLGGAMLETFAEEPAPPNLPLLQLPNVTLTPHIAGASLTTVRTAAAMVAEEVRRFMQDEQPLNPC